MRPKHLEKSFLTRMNGQEREIIERVQASFEAVGVAVSLNDVVRHLIRAAEIPRPADLEEAEAAWAEHREDCGECAGCRRPKCPDGVLIRRELQRHMGLRNGQSYLLQPVVETVSA
jgi:hypothetical protein